MRTHSDAMERAAHPFRIGGPAAASLLVNGLLIVALLNLGVGHVGRRTESPALTVMSLALLKGTEQGQEKAEAAVVDPPVETAPPSQSKPLPTPQPVVAAAAAPPIVAVPSSISIAMSAPSVDLPASPAAPSSQPVRQASVAAAAPAASTARRGAADGLDVEAPPGTSRSYAAKVRSWLYAHKIYPRRARMRREEGRVQVRFVLDRAGMLLEGSVIHGSGNAALDQEAAAMLRRASPYPRAPVELPGERMEFTAPIEFILPV
ncbi:TonB family protein [Sphingobium sp. CR2-8]|uniref:energy transducer TonB n=1 Tax=Sphingobium sp. CR2-8 TaxID=1306534 RepID=UPI002DB5C6A3|nr:TonB family protein [Sphingobium sp. CR2-8]MEC3910016.1 TonB family protein [Sphingobium sp. CR2-8]